MKQLTLNRFETALVFSFLLLAFLIAYGPNLAPSLNQESANYTNAQQVATSADFGKYISPQNDIIKYIPSQSDEFLNAIPFVLRHEGGLINDKADRGGITKYGISLMYLRDLILRHPWVKQQISLPTSKVGPATIKNLTLNQAMDIYRTQWWNKYSFNLLQNQAIATKAFDLAINMGPGKAIGLLQRAADVEHANISVTGKLDNNTVNFINQLSPAQTSKLLADYKNIAANHYRGIANHHPRDHKFLAGWLRRVNDCKMFS